jgi:hypothetical protein
MGDEVKGCIECHKTPGKMPGEMKKEMKANKASKKEIGQKDGVPCRGHPRQLHQLPQGLQQEKQDQGRASVVYQMPSENQIIF